MKIDSKMLLQYRRTIAPLKHGADREKLNASYVNVISEIKQQAGECVDLNDAIVLCNLGFFMTHSNFDSNESMHYYNGRLYYEDGACLTTSGLIEHPLEWMESGWKIKACPHEIDFDKLKEMHDRAGDKMLSGKSYTDCIIMKEV